MELTDIMKFEQLRSPSVSEDGQWVVSAAVPDRGDPRVLVYSTDGKIQYELAGGNDPVISGDGRWVAAKKTVPASELLVSDRSKDPGPKTGMLLLNTSTGEKHAFENIKSFTFSNNSLWLIFHQHEQTAGKNEEPRKNGKLKDGTTLSILELAKLERDTIPFVSAYALDSLSQNLAYVVADTGGLRNGIYSLELSASSVDPGFTLYADSSAWGGDQELLDDQRGDSAQDQHGSRPIRCACAVIAGSDRGRTRPSVPARRHSAGSRSRRRRPGTASAGWRRSSARQRCA